jgi:hypothetical protein
MTLDDLGLTDLKRGLEGLNLPSMQVKVVI